ncbi:hypothetical protein Kpho01_20800 [Kitasatospora phosalacinea]|uniref:Uncharacterized protein n=1 Tax=Kitasatospora phosalacinea TaxID=2065 RepID=A0A9W6PDU3_9ACTN|nr:hypothetical protein Kpho01_20800 [Kitasatospora phosalacinea]
MAKATPTPRTLPHRGARALRPRCLRRGANLRRPYGSPTTERVSTLTTRDYSPVAPSNP